MQIVFHEFLGDLRSRKHLDAYVAISLGIALAVLGILDVISLQALTGAVLASLSWLILNALGERKEIDQRISELCDNLRDRPSETLAADFFTENYVSNSIQFQDSFQSACELQVLGAGQTRMIIAYGGQIKRILATGGKVKFILTPPDGKAVEMAAKRGSMANRITTVREEHRNSLGRLASFQDDPRSTGSLEVKLIDIFPPYTLYGFDLSNLSKAKIFVWITPFREPSENRPGFVLDSRKDPVWFNFFKRQFDLVWNWDEAQTCDVQTLMKG